MKKWWRQRQLNKAVAILEKHYKRHVDAQHMAEFQNPDPSLIMFRCEYCPNTNL